MEIILKYFPDLTEKQKEQFAALYPLYYDWNSKINVISRKDIDNLYEHHILHSLAIAKIKQFEPGSAILDVGTGGGFPGIPLAIMFPECNFTLCDSIGKKIKVANSVADALGLKNVTFHNGRAEELHRRFDYIVSRAVTNLSDFYSWVKGCYSNEIIYLKGGDLNEEICDAMAKHHIEKGKITLFDIDFFFKEDFFAEKKAIIIR